MDNNEATLEAKLEEKSVGDIKGKFFIPSYQRGYRWGESEVEHLLDDILDSAEKGKDYYLQPIVVSKKGDSEAYELIDGQQRLTTLYLIYKYMNKENPKDIPPPPFSLSYETREKSEDFLENPYESRKDENIDFCFIWLAYKSIRTWFEKKGEASITKIKNAFEKKAKVIWYEVAFKTPDTLKTPEALKTQEAINLFTRLNIGKIPLTNAELVKAMFLAQSSREEINEVEHAEIALQWDYMEKELHNDSLWYFLANSTEKYQTRIDLVLELISGKEINSYDRYAAFFHFDKERRKGTSLAKIWKEIYQAFLMLKGWHENHELYHKIGYLVASDALTLQGIFDLAKNKDEFKPKDKFITKDEFIKAIDEQIENSIESPNKDYADLSYENQDDYKLLYKLLLLFNIESVRQRDGQSQRFPFDQHKKEKWSLEHIHAQHSEGLRTQEEWKAWLDYQRPSLEDLKNNPAFSDKKGDIEELLCDMDEARNNKKLSGDNFKKIHDPVTKLLSEKEGSAGHLHTIHNLALLDTSANSALNNSVFDVKRRRIIKMDKGMDESTNESMDKGKDDDKKGKRKYIPFCTRMVFLKYYTEKNNQLYFWGEQDREAYVKAIDQVLDHYLEKPIIPQEKKEK